MNAWSRRRCRTQLEHLVRDNDMVIQVVLPGERDDEPPFAYTVGLTRRGLPEVVVVGLDHVTSQRLLNELHALVRSGAAALVPGPVSGVLPDITLQLVRVVDTADLLAARHLFGPDIAALQLVWPDDRGRFPWDEGCSLTVQPLLGVPPT